MSNFITFICSELALTNLWSVFGTIIPLFAISVLFALGYYLVSDIIKDFSFSRADWEEYKEKYK